MGPSGINGIPGHQGGQGLPVILVTCNAYIYKNDLGSSWNDWTTWYERRQRNTCMLSVDTTIIIFSILAISSLLNVCVCVCVG